MWLVFAQFCITHSTGMSWCTFLSRALLPLPWASLALLGQRAGGASPSHRLLRKPAWRQGGERPSGSRRPFRSAVPFLVRKAGAWACAAGVCALGPLWLTW